MLRVGWLAGCRCVVSPPARLLCVPGALPPLQGVVWLGDRRWPLLDVGWLCVGWPWLPVRSHHCRVLCGWVIGGGRCSVPAPCRCRLAGCRCVVSPPARLALDRWPFLLRACFLKYTLFALFSATFNAFSATFAAFSTTHNAPGSLPPIGGRCSVRCARPPWWCGCCWLLRVGWLVFGTFFQNRRGWLCSGCCWLLRSCSVSADWPWWWLLCVGGGRCSMWVGWLPVRCVTTGAAALCSGCAPTIAGRCVAG